MARDVDGPARELARRVPPLPTLQGTDDSRLAQAHPGVLLPRLLAMARDRLEWASAELAAQIADEGLAGVVGRVYGLTPKGERVELREEVRALVALEAEERDRAASLAREIARLGLDVEQVLRDAAQAQLGAMFALLGLLGVDRRDPLPLRALRRSVMVARREQGHADADPEQFPALTAAERVEVLRAALARAERAAAEVESVAVELDRHRR